MRGTEIPITRIAHTITVPVRVNGAVESRFFVDTGIGMDLISTSLCERLGCTTSGERRGRRMSGQELTVPLTRLSSLALGPRTADDVEVGVFDMSGLPPPFAGVGGILSLGFLETAPFTVDSAKGVLVLETLRSLAAREAAGAVVPVRVVRGDGTLEMYVEMDVGAGEPALLEVDTGSDALTLDLRYMARLGVDPKAAGVRTVEGSDETGHEFVRHFARLESPVFPVAAPALRQPDAAVMFQRIVHDGLLGDSYLKAFVVTYDVPRARLILARP